MIIPGSGAQVDVAKVSPARAGEVPRGRPASGFLALLGAALKEAEASVVTAKPAAVSVVAMPEEFPGPGDSEQADGWRGAAAGLESFIQAQAPVAPAAEPVKLVASQHELAAHEVVEQGDGWRELSEAPAGVPMPPSLTAEPPRAAAPRLNQSIDRAPCASTRVPTTATPVTASSATIIETVATPKAVAPAPAGSAKIQAPRPKALPVPVQPVPNAPVRQVQVAAASAPDRVEVTSAPAQPPVVADAKPESRQNRKAEPEMSRDVLPMMQPGIEMARIAAQALTAAAPRPAAPQQPASTTPDSVAAPSITQVAAPIMRTPVDGAPTSRAAEAGRRAKADAAPLASAPEEPANSAATPSRARIEPQLVPLPVDAPVKVTQVVTSRGHDNPAAPTSAPMVPKPVGVTPVADSAAPAPAANSASAEPSDPKPASTRARSTLVNEPNLAAAGTQASLAAAPHKTSEPAATQPAAAPAPVRAPAEPVAQPKGTERVTIQLPGHDGEMTRVRIAVRGDQVRTTLVSSDGATAARLSSQAPELERALAARGFRDAEVVVPAPASPLPARDAGPVAALSVAASGSSSGEALQGNNRHADGSAGDSRQGTAERDRESPDQRAEHQQPRQGRSHQRARRERAR